MIHCTRHVQCSEILMFFSRPIHYHHCYKLNNCFPTYTQFFVHTILAWFFTNNNNHFFNSHRFHHSACTFPALYSCRLLRHSTIGRFSSFYRTGFVTSHGAAIRYCAKSQRAPNLPESRQSPFTSPKREYNRPVT